MDPDENCFFGESGNVLVFSAKITEVVNGYLMTNGVVMVMDRLGGLHMFFESFCKCSARLSYIFLLTIHPATPVSIHYSTFLKDGVSFLGIDYEVLDSTASSEMHLNAMFSVMFLQLWLSPLIQGTTM